MQSTSVPSQPASATHSHSVPSDLPPDPSYDPKNTLRMNELMPSLSRWATLTGLFIVGSIGATVAIASVAKYNVAVKAAATVRPAGELRIVQAELEGKIDQIVVQENDEVRQGDAIAYLDDTKLQIQKSQLQSSIQQNQLQLSQVESQVRFLNLQMLAEEQSTDKSIAAAESEVVRAQRERLEKSQIAQAEFAEAQVALAQAEDDRDRHRPLLEAGAIARSVFQEKETAVSTARARLERSQAAVDPSAASVVVAEQQVAQQSARGQSTIASLQKEREALIQRQSEVQAILTREQQELQKLEADMLNTVIRSSSDGVIFKLNLANINQVVRTGDSIAQISPQGAALVVRATVANQDIDKVAVGQSVRMRVDACPYPDYGVLPGVVRAIAPDSIDATNKGAEATAGGAAAGGQAGVQSGGKSDRAFSVVIEPESSVLKKSGPTCAIQSGMSGSASIISRRETFLHFVLRKARIWSSL